MVSQVTSGLISSKNAISVRFVAPMVNDNLVGEILQKQVFTFQPEIEGLAKWLDNRTLIFQPNAPLPLRDQYSGVLDIAKLLPQHKDKNLKPLEFRFQVAGRELTSAAGDFKLQKPDDPLLLTYSGTIIFTEETQLSDVRRAAKLRLNSKNLILTWETDPGGKKFNYQSPIIERTGSNQNFIFEIDKDPLRLSSDYKKEFVLSALADMVVVEISSTMDGDKTGLIVKFSDDLDIQQDIRGLIRVDPHLEINLNVVNKEVHISGAFVQGKELKIIVNPGIRSKWGTNTTKEHSETIKLEDIKPQIRFASDGVFLPTVNNQKLNFLTVNLKRVKLNIKKVFESNLGQFLQTAKLNNSKNRSENFNNWEVKRVGVDIIQNTLNIGYDKNRWLQLELDLQKIISENEKGLFLISLSFDREDMIYGDLNEDEEPGDNRRRRRYGRRDYYSDPYSAGYISRNGRIYKPVILSDIGLTYKKSDKNHIVYATNILDTSPMNGVKIALLTYQNQVIAQRTTDTRGRADFFNVDGEVFYVIAEKENQRSLVKLNEMAWNLSNFETGGEIITSDGIRAFIYTERGVYRPGDEVNISLIARNQFNTFPENHPVTMQIFNPKNQMIVEQIQRENIDGFYNFKFQSNPEDFTGNWQAKFTVGSKTFLHTIKIETVVPYRLKIKLEPAQENLIWSDKRLTLALISTYLFGSPASRLDAEVKVTLNHAPKKFSKYEKYIFTNETIEYQPITTTIFQGKLNQQGKVQVGWSLPSLENSPSAINAHITAKVFEKGGRPNQNFISIPIDPFPYYVGLLKPELRYSYTRVNTTLQIPIILIDPQGGEIAGKILNYRIYRNQYNWWWQYENRHDFRLRFKSDRNTKLVKEGNLISSSQGVQLEFTPEDRGEYLIEVADGENNGHTAGFFLRAYHWGDVPSSGNQADVLALKTDKKLYGLGETAKVSFPSPEQGSVLVSVENAQEIIMSKWYETEKNSVETTIEIPVTENFVPNVYISVVITQPHSQTVNDRPIRMYGIIPLNVFDPSTRQELQIISRDQFEPNQSFDVEIQTSDETKTQFTIAVVDEGLLDITQFITPDPWNHFFKKQRLGVSTYDLFSHIINVNKGDIFGTFSIGGGVEAAYRDSQMGFEKTKRFMPVSMFQGPIFTDENGEAKVSFDMPNYVGSVRIMAINAEKNRYGFTEKTVPVKSDLMILPTLPRVLGPQDEITVPVTVFAMEDNIGQVDIKLEIEGPAKIIGDTQKRISFIQKDEKDVNFQLKADPAIGTVKIKISATAGDRIAKEEINLTVRPSSPRIYESVKKECKPGETISFPIPDKGIPGTNEAKISIRRRPDLNFSNRLFWLIRYPYGCIEQTVSSVFPQLYLKKIIITDKLDDMDIDYFVNAGINRLRKFQSPTGAFSYWPGDDTPSIWGTNYAGHFMIEAKILGYSVPPGMLNNWIRHQKSQALTTKDNLTVRVYRTYLLALAGEPQIGALNLLKENSYKDMNDTQKWLLAGAYKLAGIETTAGDIIKGTQFKVEDYFEFGGTYGSGLRDKAIILEMLVLFERWIDANKIAEELAYSLSSTSWYSTQTTGYMLLALGKYFQALEGESTEAATLAGEIKLPNGETVQFNTREMGYSLDITEGFGDQIEVFLDDVSTVNLAFTNLAWNGVPLKDEVGDLTKNLVLAVEWLDEDGMPLDRTNISQGLTFWGHFQVSKVATYRLRLDELALVQILPAGWEIENIRLSGEDFPNWMSKWKLNQQEYVDIRDDRIMWFFDLPLSAKKFDFVVKLNAVTAGEFFLPATSVEAMYNNDYQGRIAGRQVKVIKSSN